MVNCSLLFEHPRPQPTLEQEFMLLDHKIDHFNCIGYIRTVPTTWTVTRYFTSSWQKLSMSMQIPNICKTDIPLLIHYLVCFNDNNLPHVGLVLAKLAKDSVLITTQLDTEDMYRQLTMTYSKHLNITHLFLVHIIFLLFTFK